MGIFQRRFIYLFFFENTTIISYFMEMQNFFLKTSPQVPLTIKDLLTTGLLFWEIYSLSLYEVRLSMIWVVYLIKGKIQIFSYFAFYIILHILYSLSIRGGEWWAFISPPTNFSFYEN